MTFIERLQKAAGSLAMLAISSFAGVSQIASSNPPIDPPDSVWPGVWLWIQSPSHLFLMLTAALAALSAWGTVKQLFFDPKPASAMLVMRMWRHLNRSFAALDDRIQHGFTAAKLSDEQIQDALKRIETAVTDKTDVPRDMLLALEQAVNADALSTGQRSHLAVIWGEFLKRNPDTPPLVIESAVKGAADNLSLLISALRELSGEDRTELLDRSEAELSLAQANLAEKTRELASYAALESLSRALRLYSRAVELDPAHCWTWIELCRLHQLRGDLTAANRAADQAVQVAADDRESMVATATLGDLWVIRGDLGRARECYAASIASAEDRAAQDSGNAGWQHDLSVSYEKLGDVEVASGNLGTARERFAAGLAVRERLAAQEPGNAGWQRDLTVSHSKLGDVEVASGNLGAARERFAAGLAVAERLAAQEPGNAEWQRDLAVSHDRLGDVEVASGNLGAARERFAAGLAVAERLAAQETGNAGWQRDLTVSYDRLALLAERDGDLAMAIEWLEKDEAIMSALVERSPDHPGFAKDLAWVRSDLARLRG